MVRRQFLALAAIVGMAACGLPGKAGAGDLLVEQPWARASIGSAKTGAAYFTVTNAGNRPDRLVGAATPVAESAHIHTHLMDGGVMRMRPVEGGVEVDPGTPIDFRPGGLHVMLIGLKEPLREGTSFPLSLTFERAGKVEVTVPVMAVAAMGPGAGHHQGTMPHGDMPHGGKAHGTMHTN